MNAITDILHLEGVSKRFSAGTRTIQALDDVSFSIRPGRVTGLIGPDGAGKTTLMRLATGLLIPDAGKLTVLDLDATSQSLAVQASVGYMPQRFGLYEDLSIRENLDLYADLQGVPIAERQSRYDELMHMTGLAPFMQRLAGRLSGGMKQKLGLACTLVHPPRLLLLDEPTVGVDPVSRRELWEIVYRLVEDAGMSVLLSTAYLDEAERCSEVVLLHEGHVLGQGAPEDFSREMQATAHEVTVRGMNKRRLQQRLSEIPGTVDAVVQGDAVRWVTRNAAPRLPENLPAPQIRRVEARFEDSFIERLRSEGNAGQASGLEAAMRPESGDGRAVIEVENLTRRFGDFVAVSGLGFHVARGEVFGLLGANGAGKTTTFRMLCGLLPPSDGSLQVAGHDLRHAAAEARARIGYMSQKFSLYTNLSVNQNLRFYA
ncbi:MAG: ATP-binding cassette domain-containing protein, partial [Gammaproteobacteria bacterium]